MFPSRTSYVRVFLNALRVGFFLIIFSHGVSAATSTQIINTSSVSTASQPSTMKNIVRTSDGTLHSFLQVGTQSATCNGNSRSGLLWFISTDSGATWACQEQISSDTTNLMYASATVDSSNNIYLVYSIATTGGSTSYDVFYRKLTKGGGATWTVGSAQTVLDSVAAGTAYQYATIQVQGTARLWVATRYFDGTNYRVSAYYSDGLTDAPTWTVSQADLDTPGTVNSRHFPILVRYGNNIGVIYTSSKALMIFGKFRADTDGLTSWSPEATVNSATGVSAATYSAVGDTNGNIYVTGTNGSGAVLFNYFNGTVWSATTTVSTTSQTAQSTSISTDGTNVWVFYGDTTNVSQSGLNNARKVSYKKGMAPFSATDFDTNPTQIVSYHGSFDKVWSFVGSAYTDVSTAAGNTTAADTQMVTSIGDIMYFGKTVKFDAIHIEVSTSGLGGAVTWEYWNGSTWSALTFTSSASTNFGGNGRGSFTDPADWATTTVNGEGTPYYYIRARATSNYSTTPVGTQFVSIPATQWLAATQSVESGSIYTMWTENATTVFKVRSKAVSVSASTANTASSAEIDPKVIGYSSTANATGVSTMKHVTTTSDGTIHAFVGAGTQNTCGGSTGSNNTSALVWIYSTDAGVTWSCGGQLSSDTSNLFYASVTTDTSDNMYVVYSQTITTGGTLKNVYYRKFTKGAGSTWTMGTEQAIVSGNGSTGYHYAVVELQGTTRLWMATRYFDGTNYQVSVYYSDGLSAAPTWTLSQTALDTANTTNSRHYPAIVRFGSQMGVIYSNDSGTSGLKWRTRNDSDGLTTWAAETLISSTIISANPIHTAFGDSTGNVYLAANFGTNVYFTYFNGTVWSTLANLTSTAVSSAFTGLASNGTDVWVVYGDTNGLSTSLSGNRKLVYKKGVAPFATANFDASPTQLISHHAVLDKYWSFVSSAFTNDTTDSASTTVADTQIVSGVGDSAYFGKLAKFDSISWALSTSGTNGQVVWEYWNGSAWVAITDFVSTSLSNFTGTGYISFIPNSDWATTSVNSDGLAYYYVRARVITAYGTPPVGTQIVTIPQITWAGATNSTGKIHSIWTENANQVAKVRYTSFTVNQAPTAPSSLGPTNYVNGSTGNDNTPTVTFTLADPDGADTVKYQIQIDNNADFSSPTVDYTSALATQGTTSFTVGQAAGSGTYTVGTAGQTLSDTSYYWRVKTLDTSNYASAYTTANSGAVAFIIDATGPSIPGIPFTTSPTTSTSQVWNWTASVAPDLNHYAWRVLDSLNNLIASGTTTLTSVTTNLTSGLYSFFVKAVDNLGNESTEAQGSVDVQTPTPTITPLPSNGTIGGTSTSSGSSSGPSECSASKPSSAPDLFQINTEQTSATLYFAPAGNPVTAYYISYGPNENADQWGVAYIQGSYNGVLSYTIKSLSSGTKYYFKVRAGNGCASGEWSHTLSAVTKYNTGIFDSGTYITEKKIEIESTTLEKKKPITKKPSVCSYTVKPGDTLWSISTKELKNGNRNSEIKELNNLKSNTLKPGSTLELPCAANKNIAKLSPTPKPKQVARISPKASSTKAPKNKIAKKVEIPSPPTTVVPTPIQDEGYILNVKVLAQGKPLEGVEVTLHSKVQKAKTDKEGIAHFNNVEEGEHTVLLAKDEYKGEQKVNITGEEKEQTLTVNVTMTGGTFSKTSIVIISILGTLVLLMGAIIIRQRRS